VIRQDYKGCWYHDDQVCRKLLDDLPQTRIPSISEVVRCYF
jgi:hypothetical protein